MSAFLIFHGTIKDAEKFGRYGKAVPPTLKSFGGEIFLRGKAGRVLAGEHDHKIFAMLKFPDLNNAHGWYQSDAYQALIQNRDEAADFTVISFEEPN
jgi:uncharacterized protein (DUF1330 family)